MDLGRICVSVALAFNASIRKYRCPNFVAERRADDDIHRHNIGSARRRMSNTIGSSSPRKLRLNAKKDRSVAPLLTCPFNRQLIGEVSPRVSVFAHTLEVPKPILLANPLGRAFSRSALCGGIKERYAKCQHIEVGEAVMTASTLFTRRCA